MQKSLQKSLHAIDSDAAIINLCFVMFKKITYFRMHLQPTLYNNAKHIQHSRNSLCVAALSSFQIDSSPQRLNYTNSLTGSSFKTRNHCYALSPNLTQQLHFFHTRTFSTQNDKGSQTDGNKNDEDEDPLVAMYDERGNKLSNWARMKMMAKAYGYVIIPVHWVIAPVWFGSFYLAVTHGIDIVPLLKSMGVSEVYLNKMQNSGASDLLQAYAMYKVATPARYTLTLGATEMTIRALRKHGFMKPLPPKEKTYRESMQETYAGVKEKMEDVKEDVKEKMDDVKDKMSDVKDKMTDVKEDMKEKIDDVKDKMSDVKDKMSEVRDKLKDGEKDKQN